MYRILKEKGNNVSITLENTETKASIIIGRLSMDILSLLEREEGIHFSDSEIQLKDKWELTIKDETAKELSAKAMRMSKPVRDQSKKSEQVLKKDNKSIDAMDVLLGLASYN